MAEPDRLVEANALASHAPGLVNIVQHKEPLNPNAAISMPGIPAQASPALKAAMKQQDMLLNKIVKMEKMEERMDPLHKKARRKWLKLAKSVQHMAPSPQKLKNEHLLLMLAKNLAKKEMIEHENMKKLAAEQAHAHAVETTSSKHAGVTSTTYSRCFERACLQKLKNGFCGAAVVSCQQVPAPAETQEANHGRKAPKVKDAQAAVKHEVKAAMQHEVKAAMQHEVKAAMERAALAKVLPFLKKLASEQQEQVVPEVSELELPESLPRQSIAQNTWY